MSPRSLTLPSGVVITDDSGDEAGLIRRLFLHKLAALSERLCPDCSSPLGPGATCLDPRHRPCVWHVCRDRERVRCSYLDVPHSPWPCDRCA